MPIATLDDAVRHHDRVRTEREPLETTLTAAVNRLTEVLAMVAPLAFQRATFARSAVQHALTKLDWSDGWICSVAAALSQLGCVGMPPELMQADAAQRHLGADEHKPYANRYGCVAAPTGAPANPHHGSLHRALRTVNKPCADQRSALADLHHGT